MNKIFTENGWKDYVYWQTEYSLPALECWMNKLSHYQFIPIQWGTIRDTGMH